MSTALDAPNAPLDRGRYLLPSDDTGFAPCLGPVSGADLSPVLSSLRAHHPTIDQADLERVVAAFDIADVAHADQRRASGDPYIVHPLAVAAEVAELGMDADTVAAALCHDVVEDTPVTVAALAAAIGPLAASLVDGVTKLDAVADASKAQRVAGSLRKLLVAACTDIRVLVIKLADRLHNMRTLDALAPAKRARIAAETLEVYAPLAHRLGMSETKAALEDAAFAVLEPEKAAEISALIDAAAPSSAARLSQAVAKACAALEAAGLTVEVTGRKKHVYSAYRKMVVRQVPFTEIADLIGLRVIVSTPAECYAALGVLHAAFTPVPARFRDYIALPKWGNYRSLHTTLVDADGVTFEVQVRTWEMHAQAEFGVAAHWKYKANAVAAEASTVPPAVGDLPWLSGLLSAGAAEVDPEEFLAALRRDLGVGEVVALTPAGDVVPLPAGATALDFAYHVHTEVGNHAVAARINGRLCALGTRLAAGDRVEVVTGARAEPCTDWLGLVTTGRATHAIRAHLSARRRDDTAAAGREDVARACRDAGLPSTWQESLDPNLVAAAFGHTDLAGLYAAVGEGHLAAGRVAARVRHLATSHGAVQLSAPIAATPSAAGGDVAFVDGIDDALLTRAPCCRPGAGADTVGVLLAPGRVVVHRADCVTAATRSGGHGLLEVDLTPDDAQPPVLVEVEAIDRPGLLVDVCTLLGGAAADVAELHAATGRDRVARIAVRLRAADLSHLARVTAELASLDGVFRVTSPRNADQGPGAPGQVAAGANGAGTSTT